MKLSRVPIESAETVMWLARLRLALVVIGLVAVALLDFPYHGRLSIVLAAVGLPWAVAVFLLARSSTDRALSPLVAVGDLAILAVAEIVAPDSYAGIRFLALFFIAAHANFQGERRGTAIALGGVAALVPIAAVSGDPIGGELLAFYETLFAVSAVAAAFFVGRLRTSESAGRLRARELSRRVMEAEAQVRRRVSESIHDGPVQELVSLDMMLASAQNAVSRGEPARAVETLGEARKIAERNIGALRDEMVGLGPYAFDELSLPAALEQCAPTWQRRYQMEVELDLEPVDLSNELCGSLFGIAQEAVANAGRHAEAERVRIAIRRVGERVELRVADDGHGFREGEPLGADAPGHIGLASMRERAELIAGELDIETSDRGTKVLVRAPLAGDVSFDGKGVGRG